VREDDILCGLSTGIGTEVDPVVDRPAAYPNPVEAGGLLQFTSTGVAELRLTDLSGRTVWHGQVNTASPQPVPANVRPGTYVLSVDDGRTRTEQKLMVR
jgi:hypothetical protein